MPVDDEAVDHLADMLAGGEVVALTGAGMSTGSGIPDYRGPDRVPRANPMTVSQLRSGVEARRRYWARSFIGWPRFASAAPNEAHRLVARLEGAGMIRSTITQNVDGLHQEAGARAVLELHGSLGRVICLTCGETRSRAALQEDLAQANPEWVRRTASTPGEQVIPEVRPDGDAEVTESMIASFRLVGCLVCGSDMLKPDVVMFGENVEPGLLQRCYAECDTARTLLVLGSSLSVFSGYRFAKRARAAGIPVAIVTRGRTRADGEVALQIDGLLDDVLARACSVLGV